MNFLESFPYEISLLILERLDYSDIVKVSRVFSFCDWEFWRNKARKELNIPSWYFDLGLQRNVSGDYRYLEIQSKTHIIPESEAKIINGKVEGIYSLDLIKELAENWGKPLSILDMYGMENAKKNKMYRQCGLFPMDYKNIAHIHEKFSQYTEMLKLGKELPPMDIYLAGFLALNYPRKYLSELKKFASFGVDSGRIYEDDYKYTILVMLIASGDLESFQEIYTKETKYKKGLLLRAYICLEEKFVEFLQEDGVRIDEHEISTWLDYGNKHNPKPVAYYNLYCKLIKEYPKLNFYTGIDDVDVFFLVRDRISFLSDYVTQGNTPVNIMRCALMLDKNPNLEFKDPIKISLVKELFQN